MEIRRLKLHSLEGTHERDNGTAMKTGSEESRQDTMRRPCDARYVVLFGLGVLFRDCYRQLSLAIGREPDFLSDNAPDKWGREFFGRKCISPEELRGLGRDTAVVITVKRYEEVFRQLSGMGLENIFVACFDRGYDIVHGVKRLGDGKPESCGAPIDLQGKWTLVTGASRGIGRRIALEMARLGSNIIAHSRQLSHTEELAGACSSMGAEIMPIAADLGNPAEVEAMLDDLERHFPPVDIVFNNAGISLPCKSGPWDISSEDYIAHYTVNTVAPIRICYRLIPPMIRRGFGRVVNISSTIQRRPGEMAYACSKAALSKFVYDLAPGLEGTGVMISLVCPGHVRSDMGGPDAPRDVESVFPGAFLGAVMNENVNGRWFIAQDYAGLGLEAAMDRAHFYYGQEDH